MASKTERTRERIADAATSLFLDKGFDETTVADIARAAAITEMTFYRYFATKSAVILDDPYDPVIAQAIAAQPRRLSPLTRVTGGIRSAWRQLPEPQSELTRQRTRIASSSATLRAGMWQNNEQTERIIVEQLVADGTDPLIARVAASACLAALMAALLDWAESDSSALGDRVLLALDVLDGAA